MSVYDYEARYVVQAVSTRHGKTHVHASLDPDPSNRIAVMAGADTCYGFADVSDVDVNFVVTRQPNYIRPGDVIKVQSAHRPTIVPKPVGAPPRDGASVGGQFL